MKIIKIIRKGDAVDLKEILRRWRIAREEWNVDKMFALIPYIKEGGSRLVNELVRELKLYQTNLRTIGKEKEILSNGDFVSERIKECKQLVEKFS